MWQGRHGLIRRFIDNRDGNFAILAGVSMSAIAMAVGFGINLTQAFHVKSSLRNALDAAVTSTARDLTTGKIDVKDARSVVEAFLAANNSTQYANYPFVLDTLTIDQTARTIDATASTTVDLAFPLFTTKDPKVAISSAAVYSDKTIEVAMMLDVTGSMAGQKIKDLRTAAGNAVDAFLGGQDPAKPRVRVAIVPYANSVNAGALASATVFVEKSMADRKQAPGSEDPKLASTGGSDNCATERKGAFQYTDDPVTKSLVNRDYLLTKFAKDGGTLTCPAAAVTPLSSDIAALKSTIKDLSAQGGTGGHIGVQWAWYMLSEKWGSVMKPSQRPAVADPKKVAKYAILMTDGEFNLSYFDVDSASKVYDDKGKVATRTAAKTLCAAMKDEGIEIFSIGFKLENSDAKETMEDCASADTSSLTHYFETSTGAELDAAFQEIARNIERLALTR